MFTIFSRYMNQFSRYQYYWFFWKTSRDFNIFWKKSTFFIKNNRSIEFLFFVQDKSQRIYWNKKLNCEFFLQKNVYPKRSQVILWEIYTGYIAENNNFLEIPFKKYLWLKQLEHTLDFNLSWKTYHFNKFLLNWSSINALLFN